YAKRIITSLKSRRANFTTDSCSFRVCQRHLKTASLSRTACHDGFHSRQFDFTQFTVCDLSADLSKPLSAPCGLTSSREQALGHQRRECFYGSSNSILRDANRTTNPAWVYRPLRT